MKLIERTALTIYRRRRLGRLENTVAASLGLGHIDSLELLELTRSSLRHNPVIYDIGSNIGTWTLLAKAIFPEAAVHAFEPLRSHNMSFKKNCAALKNVYLNPYCAGNEDGSAVINISSFSDASSLLPATTLEFEHFKIQKEGEEQVEIKRLGLKIESGELPPPDLIKLDIQGFELEALKGIGIHLAKVQFVICEVSFKPYYQNQPLFLDISNYLAQFGLEIFAFGHNTPVGSELNQIDVLFKRSLSPDNR